MIEFIKIFTAYYTYNTTIIYKYYYSNHLCESYRQRKHPSMSHCKQISPMCMVEESINIEPCRNPSMIQRIRDITILC